MFLGVGEGRRRAGAGSCLAQSGSARTGYGRRTGLGISYFSRHRISRRDGEFFDDSSDHEFENSPVSGPKARRSGVGVGLKYLESRSKIACAKFFAGSHGVSNFALENESKALAFCAARSHIVAVR
jgi:hypothetical protein